jgi:integrase
VHNPKPKGGDGFIAWTEEHAAAYQARWPIGTRQQVWFDVLLYTGLRRGDAVRVGRQHARGGSIKTEKGGFTVEVPVFILPVLQETLDAGPCGDLRFIVGENGRLLPKESFGNLFKDACKAAGVPGSAHGVRKLAATRTANNGATEKQLMAVFGWTDPKMAAHYTRTADSRRLAAEAIDKLNAPGTSIPAPSHPVRAASGKSK